jgi:serine/threonine protein kinase
LDLKPSNVLIDQYGRPKLADFGNSHPYVARGFDDGLEFYIGSIPYMCPEMIAKKRYDPIKADVWAFGVMLYKLSSGGFPWRRGELSEMQNDIRQGITEYPQDMPVALRQTLGRMMDVKTAQRPNMDEVLTLPFFAAPLDHKYTLDKRSFANQGAFGGSRSSRKPACSSGARRAGSLAHLGSTLQKDYKSVEDLSKTPPSDETEGDQ